MAIDIEKAIKRGYTLKKAGIHYSMDYRWSNGFRDCSSFVYDCLTTGGASKERYPVSTESEHAWLKKNGFVCIAKNTDWNMQRGDVVIWGRLGYSAGEGGHTLFCIDHKRTLECTAWKNGVIVSNHDERWSMCGDPYFYAYRYKGKKVIVKSKKKPKVTNTNKYAKNTKVKLLTKATKYQTGQKINSSVKGKTYTVKQVKKVNQSHSKYAFLLSGINSWVLAQDIQKVNSGSKYKKHKPGDTVTLQKFAKKYQTKQTIPNWCKGKKYKIVQVKDVKQSKSKRAYLLSGIMGWVLEQDVK